MKSARYGRLVDDVVTDVIDGDPAEYFHPDLAKEFVRVAAHVERNWRRVGKKWIAPDPVEPPAQSNDPRGDQ